MPFCPNPNCDHRQRLGEPAEFLIGIKTCPDCGGTLSETVPQFEVTVSAPEDDAGWTCPQCGSINHEDISLCSCGHDYNRTFSSDLPIAKNPSDFFGTNQDGHEEESERRGELLLRFQGSASEYFRIWIVNLCLTLLTLGIFSAWAKVRKKRYFYSNTTLDGTPFQYLGQPIPILKGRVVAAAAFLLYYASSHFFISLLPYVFVIGIALAPWVIVRSAAFNARYSAYRNMTFHFDGQYFDAVKAIYLWGLIPAFAIGVGFNWWGQKTIAAVGALAIGFTFPWLMKRLKDFIVSRTSYGKKNGVFSATGGQFFSVYFKSGLIMSGILICAGLLTALAALVLKKSPILILFMLIPLYAGYVMAYAYAQAHSSNLVWNNTKLGPLSFKSTLSGRGMAKLYVSNALAIIASLGLLIPWAVMRSLKYRADNMRVLQSGELAEFQGSDMSSVNAVGAETVDFFDMDISL
jgi:uncharacterized membrane protein YjgN (DUF898 family)